MDFFDEYVIQRFVTADNTYDESEDAPSDSDKNDFEPNDYSGTDDFDSDDEAPLSKLVKDGHNLNHLQSSVKKKTQRDHTWKSMKEGT